MRRELLELAADLARRHRPYVLATVVWSRRPTSGKQGSHAIVEADGTVHGWIGGACAEPTVLREARRVLNDGEPRLLHLGPEDELDPRRGGAVGPDGRADVLQVPIACASEGALEVFMEPVLPQPQVVLVGRSPAVRTLTGLLVTLDWRATIVDNPPSAAPLDSGGLAPPSARGELPVDNPPSVGDSTEDLDERVEVVTSVADAGVDDTTAIVVATQGHDDEAALEAALATDAAWIGLVASRRRGETQLGYLRDRGYEEEQLARVATPAGMDLGRIEHREIGVAILAELVALKARGGIAGVASTAADLTEPETGVDPVCGMTVELEGAKFTSEYEGTLIPFCCPACKRLFDEDPTRYLDPAH